MASPHDQPSTLRQQPSFESREMRFQQGERSAVFRDRVRKCRRRVTKDVFEQRASLHNL